MRAELVCSSTDEQWLDLRRTGIGASDMPIVLGIRPGLLPLWAEKTGKASRPPLEGEWVVWGHRLEPIIIQVFSDMTGWEVRRSGQLFRSSMHPWALATLDAEVEVEGVWYPLEIKTTSTLRAGDWEGGPPEAYRVQVHQQMLVTGASRAYIACLIGGQKMVWDIVERDERMIRRILASGSEFWSYVENDTPPPYSSSGAYEMKQFFDWMYPKDDGSIRELPFEFDEVFDELETIAISAKTLEARKTELQNRVREAMGTATKGQLMSGRSFTWKTQQKRGHVVPPSEIRVLRTNQRKETNQHDRTYH